MPPLAGPGGEPAPETPDGDDDNGGAPDSGAGFTSPDEVSGSGGYDGDAGGGVNEPAPDPEPQEPAPDNTTGVGGDMGDDAASPEDQAADGDANVPADSVTGVTGDGTTVHDRNEPADVEEDRYIFHGSSVTWDRWYDLSNTENGQSPGGTGTGTTGDPTEEDDYTNDDNTENYPTNGPSNNPDSPVGDNDIDGDGEVETNPFNPGEWDPPQAPDVNVEVPDIEVPGGPDLGGLTTWLKVAVVGGLFVGVMWLLRPVFAIVAGVTD